MDRLEIEHTGYDEEKGIVIIGRAGGRHVYVLLSIAEVLDKLETHRRLFGPMPYGEVEDATLWSAQVVGHRCPQCGVDYDVVIKDTIGGM